MDEQESCQSNREAFQNHELNAVEKIITAHISALGSNNAHTSENLDRLTARLNGTCLQAVVLCFACINTLPEQSEIRVTFPTSSGTISRIIDISPTSLTDSRMKFVNMHE
ncbi:MAG: hypothetical protein EOO88_52905 [Pedobacter sp.]|nr:MAG: hypothetical protein EOO88_52905 [Pedobacter sp.]